jgi:leukotriene-A4 hydrolase
MFMTRQGFNLLFHLEQIVGKAEFEAFAKTYLERFKFGVVSSGEFKDYFIEYFSSSNPEVDNLDWDRFFYGRGERAIREGGMGRYVMFL